MDRQIKLKTLSPDDAEVLDALLEAPFNANSSAGLSADNPRAFDARCEQVIAKFGDRGRRIVALLKTIDQFPAEEPAANLDERVAARVTDTFILDALLDSESGLTHDQVVTDFGDRASRVTSLLDTIGYIPADAPPDDLVQRTLARIENTTAREKTIVGVIGSIDEDRPAATGTDGAAASSPAIAFRWTELISVAAILLIGLSLLFPIMNKTRSDAMRVACASNLGASSMAIDNYAMDNLGFLPRYDVKVGHKWWNVGQPIRDGLVQSNSANLFLLPRQQYINNPNLLGCPSNPDTPKVASSAFDWPNARAVSYSYQNQYTDQPIRMGRVNNVALLADKNPMFTPTADGFSLMFNEKHDPSKPGHRHNNPGQMVLLIDGRVVWTTTPDQLGDNIYTAQNFTKNYTGTETPANMSDSFLVP